MSFLSHFRKCPACAVLQNKNWTECVLCGEEFTPILHSASIKYFLLEDNSVIEHRICQNKTCVSRAKISNKILISNGALYTRRIEVS